MDATEWCGTAIVFALDAVAGAAAAVGPTLPLAALVGAIVWLGRRSLAPWARHALWTLVLARLLLPTSFPSPVSLASLAGAVATAPASAPAVASEVVALAGPASPRIEEFRWIAPPRASEEAFPIDPAAVVVLATLAAALGSLVVAVSGLVASRRSRLATRRGAAVRDPETLALLEEGRRAFGWRVEVTLLIVPGLAGPATIGWRRPVVLLPDDVASWSRAELRHVLWHELAHLARRDGLTVWLVAVARVFHWWNPLFWIVRGCWLEERELACDAAAIERLGPEAAADYGRTLLRFAARASGANGRPLDAATSFVGGWGAKQALGARLRAVARGTRRESVGRRVVAAALVAAVALVGLTDAAPTRIASPDRETIALPAGVTWRATIADGPTIGLASARASEGVTTVEYDLAPAVARLTRDDPTRDAEGAARELYSAIAWQTSPTGLRAFYDVGDASSSLSPEERTREWCRLAGTTLTVVAPPRLQAWVKRWLERQAERGDRFVRFRVEFATTRRGLDELLRSPGGEIVVAARPVVDLEFDDRASDEVISAGTAQYLASPEIPTFVRTLAAAERESLLHELRADPECFIGTPARLGQTEGLRVAMMAEGGVMVAAGPTRDADDATPAKRLFQPTGRRVHLSGWIDEAERVELRLQVACSWCANVDRARVVTGESVVEIETPHMIASRIDASATLARGETLLVVPLRRDAAGRWQLVLATAEPDAEE